MDKAEILKKIMEQIEDEQLLKIAESRTNSISNTIPFEEVLKEQGITLEELDRLVDTIEFEE